MRRDLGQRTIVGVLDVELKRHAADGFLVDDAVGGLRGRAAGGEFPALDGAAELDDEFMVVEDGDDGGWGGA